MSDAAIDFPPSAGLLGLKTKFETAVRRYPRTANADGMDKRNGTATMDGAPKPNGTSEPKDALLVTAIPLTWMELESWLQAGTEHADAAKIRIQTGFHAIQRGFISSLANARWRLLSRPRSRLTYYLSVTNPFMREESGQKKRCGLPDFESPPRAHI